MAETVSGLRRSQLSEVHGLEKEYARLDNIVAELELDKRFPNRAWGRGLGSGPGAEARSRSGPLNSCVLVDR